MNEDDKVNMGLKPSFSILGGVGWLIFIIIWFAFYASSYSWEKNLSIILLSILIVFLLLGGMWAIWSLRLIPKSSWEVFKITGFKWRVIVSILFPFLAIIFLIFWFWYYAEPYSVWQNIAVLLVTLLALGGILGAIWARWGIQHSHEFEKYEEIGEEFGKKVEEAFNDKKENETKNK